jgi:hypothetical protein
MFDIFYLDKKPGLFPHEQLAESIEDACGRSRTRYCWIVNYLSDYTGWDWLWEPVPWQSHQRHAWASQWQKDSGTYLVPCNGYTETNYHSSPIVTRLPSSTAWSNTQLTQEFDYSWHPDPTEPGYTYVFGTDYYEQGGPVYTVPGTADVKYVSYPRARLTPDMSNWKTLHTVSDFDYSWRPHPQDPPYVYVFGNQWHSAEKMPTVEYHAPGAVHRKYMSLIAQLAQDAQAPWKILENCNWDHSWVPDPGDPPYIYVFGNQWWPAEKMPTVEYHAPGATERKYMSYPVAQLRPESDRWEIPAGVDVSDVDFSWRPDPQDPPYVYQFATQHQKTGGPRYVVPGAADVKYLEQIKIHTSQVATAIYEIDHMDGHAGQLSNTIKTVRFVDNYRDTLTRIARHAQSSAHEFVWICSSVCDYAGFDFSWHPEQWQARMLHVFASNEQKFGDTFFMHVPTFLDRIERYELLEWYECNFVNQSVPRYPLPVIAHGHDSHVTALANIDITAPLVILNNSNIEISTVPTIALWRTQTRTITPLSPGAAAMIMPKTALPDIKTQMYDYQWIDRSHRQLHAEAPLDVVFVSNGESDAESNWQWLQQQLAGRLNRLIRVDGVSPRLAAYQQGWSQCITPWAWFVPAKLKVNADFDWTWQPDRMQQAKHYIFHAYNPITELEYGHMAMIALNRDLVLRHPGTGLDFAMEQPHEVVPVRSGTARHDGDAWTAWRTAFRECVKLQASLPNIENSYRLQQWLAADHYETHQGAQAALDYYQQVQGDPSALRLTYEWQWINDYYQSRQT